MNKKQLPGGSCSLLIYDIYAAFATSAILLNA